MCYVFVGWCSVCVARCVLFVGCCLWLVYFFSVVECRISVVCCLLFAACLQCAV